MAAIKVENLSKRYKLGLTHAGSVRELLNGVASRLLGGARPTATKVRPEQAGRVDEQGNFWALKDISFEVQPGEVVGIIGKNGAGKSTLLKLLSRITSPSAGRITLRGRVASLLEVGTGFHPELTGRENVYMNGTILGMTRKEIDRQFDAIVEFAGVSSFIDTPVKRYSSGMTVRLGFAVAAHLNPEILIVDEVLAVGDVEFQKKCLGKMQEVSDSGRTVLFVSHNMASIRELTSKSLMISNGQLLIQGPTEQVIQEYVNANTSLLQSDPSVARLERAFSGLTRDIEFSELKAIDSDIKEGTSLCIKVGVSALKNVGPFRFGISIVTHEGTVVGTAFSDEVIPPSAGAITTYDVHLPTHSLAPGMFHLAITMTEHRTGGKVIYDSLSDVVRFVVHPNVALARHWNRHWGGIRFAPLIVQADDQLPLSPN